ncbi:MAG: lysophospholipid acyltransferase family protein [Kineosporiaceae bacterium]
MSAPRTGEAGGPGAAAERALSTPGWWWGRWIAFALSRVLWRVRTTGPMAPSGAFLLAVNHVNVIDGPLVWAVHRRPTHFLVKTEMFRGLFGWALREVGQIPVDRSRPDRAALATAVHALRTGRIVGVFPEGARGRGDVSEVRTGIAWLALQAGAPVVPVAVLGTRRSGERAGRLPPLGRRLHVVVGEPFAVDRPEGRAGRALLADAAEQVRARLAAHVRAAVAGTGVDLPDDAGEGR